MNQRTQIEQAVLEAIEELNEQRPRDDRLPARLETPLAGDEGGLDSFGLVTLAVLVEQRLEAALGTPPGLLDGEGLDLGGAPFRTVGSLIAFLEERLSPSADAG